MLVAQDTNFVIYSRNGLCIILILPWYTMVLLYIIQCHDKLHCTLVILLPWCIMVNVMYHGKLQCTIGKLPWCVMVNVGYHMVYCYVPWYTIVYHGKLQSTIVYHSSVTMVRHGKRRVPWYIVMYHGIP